MRTLASTRNSSVRLEPLAYIEDDGHLSLPGWPQKVVWLNP